jgi:hypothetical protein
MFYLLEAYSIVRPRLKGLGNPFIHVLFPEDFITGPREEANCGEKDDERRKTEIIAIEIPSASIEEIWNIRDLVVLILRHIMPLRSRESLAYLRKASDFRQDLFPAMQRPIISLNQIKIIGRGG